MSSLDHLARQLNVSRTTVSAALRGHSWVTSGTRRRVLRCAEHHGYSHAATDDESRGLFSLLRITTGAPRRRVAMARHRVIIRAAKEAANELGYDIAETVIEARDGELEDFLATSSARGIGGLLVLPGANLDLLSRVGAANIPCVYADTPPDGIGLDSVSPDYDQGIRLAFERLRDAGFRKPGLILDTDLPLATRERLVSAYASIFAPSGASSPSPFFTPTLTCYNFEIWLRRHAFDCLLATDVEHVRRLTPDSAPPVFSMLAEPSAECGGLSLDLAEVGRRAVRTLHHRIDGGERETRGASPARILVPTFWSAPA